MDALKQEIATEMQRTRVDKDKLYDILAKLVDAIFERSPHLEKDLRAEAEGRELGASAAAG